MSKSLKDIINTPNFEISQKVNIFNIEVHEHQSCFLESLCFYTLQNTLTALLIFHRPVTVRVSRSYIILLLTPFPAVT